VSIVLERIPELRVNGEGRINLEKRSVRLYPRISSMKEMDSMKSGDNSDRKMSLQSEWSRVMLIHSFVFIDTDKKERNTDDLQINRN
jgi:hypothetical protein